MTVQISHNAIRELETTIAELESLTTRSNFTKKDEARHAFLLSKVAMLKSGISVTELRNFERSRLLEAAGYGPNGTKLPTVAEQEWRAFFHGKQVTQPSATEVRANLAGTESITYTQGAAGGFFVPTGFYERTFQTMKQYDAIFDDEFSNVFETADGNMVPAPVWDDVSNASVQVTEGTQSTEVDIANFGQVQLNAYAFRSKMVAVSVELLQDSNFPLPNILERVFACRHARGVGAALITGSGVSAPTGIITASLAAGATPVVAAGSSTNTGGAETGATSIGTADIGRLYAKLDPAYRPGARWYMNDATLQYLAQLLDKNGRPIVDFGIGPVRSGDGPSIWGHSVAICPSMPAMGAGKNSVLFGNPLYFIQRRVPSSMYLRMYQEKPGLVENGLVGFESWLRADSNLVAPNANFVPYQLIQQHS